MISWLIAWLCKRVSFFSYIDGNFSLSESLKRCNGFGFQLSMSGRRLVFRAEEKRRGFGYFYLWRWEKEKQKLLQGRLPRKERAFSWFDWCDVLLNCYSSFFLYVLLLLLLYYFVFCSVYLRALRLRSLCSKS